MHTHLVILKANEVENQQVKIGCDPATQRVEVHELLDSELQSISVLVGEKKTFLIKFTTNDE
jgi:hypothetical protein